MLADRELQMRWLLFFFMSEFLLAFVVVAFGVCIRDGMVKKVSDFGNFLNSINNIKTWSIFAVCIAGVGALLTSGSQFVSSIYTLVGRVFLKRK